VEIYLVKYVNNTTNNGSFKQWKMYFLVIELTWILEPKPN